MIIHCRALNITGQRIHNTEVYWRYRFKILNIDDITITKLFKIAIKQSRITKYSTFDILKDIYNIYYSSNMLYAIDIPDIQNKLKERIIKKGI